MKKIFLTLLLAITSLSTFAQATFQEVTGTTFDSTKDGSFAFADIDNDNDNDLLITGLNSSNQQTSKLYTNDGNGNFSLVSGTPFDGVIGGDVSFADVDNDNDQDVLITGLSGTTYTAKLYINNGSGSFTLKSGTPFTGVKDQGSIAFADIDNDNDLDVLITGWRYNPHQAISELYTNDGNGNFNLVIGSPFNGVRFSSIAFADIDNDNDQDLLITGEGSFSKLYENNGSGQFSEVVGTPFPPISGGAIAFADIDNDNDQDLLITGRVSSAPYDRIAKIYTNDGTGSFMEMTGTSLQAVSRSSVSFADIDNDNDQDLLISGNTSSGISNTTKLYTNDGSGNYMELAQTPFIDIQDGSAYIVDIDEDNDQDVFINGNTSVNGPSPLPLSKLYSNVCYKTTCNYVIETLCSGSQYLFSDGSSAIINSDTIDISILQSSLFMDSVIVTQIYLYPLITTTIIDSICKGSSYTFPDGYTTNIYSDTTYTSTLQTNDGCDSIVTSDIYLTRIASATVLNTCDTTSLFVSAGVTNVTWSNGVQNGVSFTPGTSGYPSSTTYYVTGTTDQGCYVEDSITINAAGDLMMVLDVNDVTPLGDPPGHNPRQFLCGSQTIKLQPWGMVPGGGNHMDESLWTYAGWDNGITSDVYFQSTVGDVYTNIATHPYGCYDTLKVTIRPELNIGISSTPANVCEGDEVELIGTGFVPGYPQPFVWSDGGSVIGWSETYNFTGTTSSNYTLTVTDENGCVDTEYIWVEVNPSPTVSVSPFLKNPMCLKDSPVPLPSAYPSGGMFYGLGASNTNSSFNPDWAGVGLHTIDYEYTSANGCEGQASVDIEVIESPDFSYSTNDLSVSLTANNLCTNYYWDFGDGNTNSLTTSPAYTYFNPGTYSVCLVCNDIANCVNCINLTFPSNISGIVNGTIGIDETIESKNFSISPNPNQGQFTLMYDAVIGGSDVLIYAVSGQLLDTYQLNKVGNSLQMDISDYQNGIYFIHIKTKNDVIIKKIIKQ